MKKIVPRYGTAHMCIIISLVSIFNACKKQDQWLEKKADKADIIPSTIENFQAFLDNDAIMNANQPTLGAVGSDNHYVLYTAWQSRSGVERFSYNWQADIYAEGNTVPADWSNPFKMILYSNICLEGLKSIELSSANEEAGKNVKGSALFYRSYAFFNLAQLFAKPYDNATASTDMGIPLRLTADISTKIERASVQQTYDRILTDLAEAENLLPVNALYQTRPSKATVNALLARVYLSMREYEKAGQQAEKALGYNSFLISFSSLSTTQALPFPAFPGNREIYYYSTGINYALVSVDRDGIIDSTLYASYNSNDLRKTIFIKDYGGGRRTFKGTYAGQLLRIFDGLATNEMYLIKAEAHARKSETSLAMLTLNALIRTRWRPGFFSDFTATTPQQALATILEERRKELPFTSNLRWSDLRRLNKDPGYEKTLTRGLNGVTYTLAPNDNRYVLLIPPDEIQLSGIQQNPR